MVYKAAKRLWVNAERDKVVEEGDPDAAFLLLAEGQEMPDEEAKKYGLGGEKAVRAEVQEDKQVSAPAATKAPVSGASAPRRS
jgi:hypothetical protein